MVSAVSVVALGNRAQGAHQFAPDQQRHADVGGKRQVGRLEESRINRFLSGTIDKDHRRQPACLTRLFLRLHGHPRLARQWNAQITPASALRIGLGKDAQAEISLVLLQKQPIDG